MASYIFDEITQTQATAFEAGDTLFFRTASPTDVAVVFTAAAGLSTDTLTLTVGGKSLTFSAAALSSDSEKLVFLADDSGTLTFGDATLGDAATITGDLDNAYYGLGGGDTLVVGTGEGNHLVDGGAGADLITVLAGSEGSLHLVGGAGDDTINGGASGDGVLTIDGGAGADLLTGSAIADRIYGFSVAGSADDGDDTINAGAGNDYVNGNGGDDIINGENGNDRLFGGGGDDTISGGNQNDSINGNKGDDVINGDDGNDTLRGGADNDILNGGAGIDVLSGDLGDDTISGGDGIDILTGGAGDDVFVYSTSDADRGTVGTGTAIVYETITDFTAGDTIVFGSALDEDDGVLLQAAGTTFTTASAASDYADGYFAENFDTDVNQVVAIQVGADTYLFYEDGFASSTIDSYILLKGVTAANLAVNDDGQLILG
jgi:serralysin